MGCFSFICKKCKKPVNSDSLSGQECTIYRLVNGKVVHKMSGEYDSYGRVFKSFKPIPLSEEWDVPWDEVCDGMFSEDKGYGLAIVHKGCEGDIPNKRSESDPEQGWGDYTKPLRK